MSRTLVTLTALYVALATLLSACPKKRHDDPISRPYCYYEGQVNCSQSVTGNGKVYRQTLSITSPHTFKKFLSEMTGLCANNFGDTLRTGRFELFDGDCATYAKGAYLVIAAPGGNTQFATFYIGAGAGTPTSVAYTVDGFSHNFDEIPINMQVYSPTNVNGMTFVANGSPFSGSWNALGLNSFYADVKSGSLNGQPFAITLSYKGSPFATAKMKFWYNLPY